MSNALLSVENLTVAYRRSGGLFKTVAPFVAVRGLDLTIAPGETYALVGESGSGKSSAARAIAGLERPAKGRIVFDGEEVTKPVWRRPARLRREIQIVFQNPDASLNPRHTVATILSRPLAMFHGLDRAACRKRAAELLADVKLGRNYLDRRPGEMSGGERQRIAIARALAADPKLILCDEILSALDVSVQANVISLLRGLQQERNIALLFISHDLAVVRWLAHRVGVLYRGMLCEEGPTENLFAPPHHPYTEALLDAVPRIGGRTERATGASVAPLIQGDPEEGCPFADRCAHRPDEICLRQMPPMHEPAPGHRIRCHVPASELLDAQGEAEPAALRPASGNRI